MARKKLTEEEKIVRRRLQKKISMQKARDKLKEDNAKYKEFKQKDNERQRKRKEEGLIKGINELTPREQRQQRKNWRESSKKHREKVKQRNQNTVANDLLEKQACSSEAAAMTPTTTPKSSTSRVEAGKKAARKNRKRILQENRMLKEQLRALKKKIKRTQCKNKILRNAQETTPVKTVNRLLIGQVVTEEIRKKLVLGEVLTKQLSKNYQSSKSNNDKKNIRKILTDGDAKRYKIKISLLRATKIPRNKKYKTKPTTVRKLKVAIQEFLERDESSRMTAGKKETITKYKIKKQIRYLNNNLFNLHKEFIKSTPYKSIKYSTFCSLRPFWILSPNAKYRNTCLCKIHCNATYIVAALKTANIISEYTPENLVKSLCCEEENIKEKCLERKCNDCKHKTIHINPYEKKEPITYERWTTKKEIITVKGREKTCIKTVKEKVICSKRSLVVSLEKNMKSFMTHYNNMIHQFRAISQVKKNVSTNEVLLHMDFSENYNCKYAEEVQSAHFGGSKQQISLHTSVLYHKIQNEMKAQCFCTLSENLRHDPVMICAHLKPVLDEIKHIVPQLTRIHFLSDGPATQYRNKTMFHLIVKYIQRQIDVDEIIWHYTEAGHGKGAPDGVGGCLKRTADYMVGHGKDVSNFRELTTCLQEKCKGIRVIAIDDANVPEIQTLVENCQIKTFKGTMQIHQLSWSKISNTLYARRLSCWTCSSDTACDHYGIGKISVYSPNSCRLHYSDVYSTSSDEDQETTTITEHRIVVGVSPRDVCVNDYVVVKLTSSTKKNEAYYVAIVCARKENELSVNFMRKCGADIFSFPIREDSADIDVSDVMEILEQPVLNNRQQYKFVFMNKYKNIG